MEIRLKSIPYVAVVIVQVRATDSTASNRDLASSIYSRGLVNSHSFRSMAVANLSASQAKKDKTL